MTNYLRLHYLGCHDGSDDLEPSCSVLDVQRENGDEKRIVVDCGVIARHQGDAEVQVVPDTSLFQDGRKIDAVFLTHAHYDHMGGLPLLTKFLSEKARIFMTKPTALAVNYLFAKELRLMADGRWVGAPKPYGTDQVSDILQRVTVISRSGEHELLPKLPVWVHPAGHISGACSYTLLIGKTRVHFAGDRCDHDQPGVLGCPPLPKEWSKNLIVAGSDCTYGSDLGQLPSWQSEMERLAKLGREALRHGRRMLIYAFALNRAGAIAHGLQLRGLAATGRVFLDGSACDFANMFASGNHKWCDRDTLLGIDQVHRLRKRRSREDVLNSRGGYIIIAPPGMGGPGGVGAGWRSEFMPDSNDIIAFSGYVAHGTDGEKILQADQERRNSEFDPQIRFWETDYKGRRHEIELTLRCQVEQFRLGGHNNGPKTIQWFRDLTPEIAVLTHGSKDALTSVENALIGSGIGRIIRSDRQPNIELEI